MYGGGGVYEKRKQIVINNLGCSRIYGCGCLLFASIKRATNKIIIIILIAKLIIKKREKRKNFTPPR